jgi:hypothetical protein
MRTKRSLRSNLKSRITHLTKRRTTMRRISTIASVLLVVCLIVLQAPMLAPAYSLGPTITWTASPGMYDCVGPTDTAGHWWYEPDFNETGWSATSLPEWDMVPLNGDRYYRGVFQVTEGGLYRLTLTSEDGLRVFVDGQFIMERGWGCHQPGCVGYPPYPCWDFWTGERNDPNNTVDLTFSHGNHLVATHVSSGGFLWSSYLDVKVELLSPSTSTPTPTSIPTWTPTPTRTPTRTPTPTVTPTPQVDLAIVEVTPIQVVPTGPDIPLVVGKQTAVRVKVRSDGATAVNNVEVGLEYENLGFSMGTFYVSEEGNWDENFALKQNSSKYPLSFPKGGPIEKEVYFFADELTPTEEGEYRIRACVSHVADTNAANNCGETLGTVSKMEPKTVVFVPIETVPAGYEEAVRESLDFANAVFPVSGGGLARLPIPVQPYQPSLRDRLDPRPIDWLLSQLSRYGLLAEVSDRIIGVAPVKGWLKAYKCPWPGHIGCGDYTGGAQRSTPHAVVVELGWGKRVFNQEVAHELGHTFGHWCEDYQLNCDQNPDYEQGVGSHVHGGLWAWPNKRILMNDSDERQGKKHVVTNIMGAGLMTTDPEHKLLDAWFPRNTYQNFLSSWESTRLTAQATQVSGGVLISGKAFAAGYVELDPWYLLPGAIPDAFDEVSDFAIRVLDTNERLLFAGWLPIDFLTYGVDEEPEEAITFALVLPNFPETHQIVIEYKEVVSAQRLVTPNSPVVEITTPQDGDVIPSPITVEWQATDLDGDILAYTLLVSTDNGITWQTMALDLETASYQLPLPVGAYRLKVIVTDGINTSEAVSGSFFVRWRVFLPLVIKGSD